MHLHNHSQFSVIDGKGTIEEYLKNVKEDGQEAFALTDHGTLGGIIELYTTAKKYGVKPIAGIELYVDAVELREKDYPGHLTVLAKNEEGYRALISANNLAAKQFYYRPRLTLQQILDNHFNENWIILSGCQSSPIHHREFSDAENIVKRLAETSAGFFLEFMIHDSDDEAFNVKQKQYLERVSELRKRTGLPLVITNDCHYAHKHVEDIHHDLLSRAHGETETLEFDGTGFHFKSISEMETMARELGAYEAVDNAVEIGKICNLVIPEADKINWYVPDITGGFPKETIEDICGRELGLDDPISDGIAVNEEYLKRYKMEMDVLSTSPAILNSYLVAHDIIEWCNSNRIPAAARGSMAGSLVSYLLGITTEDPVKYRLSFNRAVNPARPTIPDFDLDVSSDRRQEVVDYLKAKYENLVPISSYTHYGPKGALRKVLRIEGMRNPMEANEMSKLLPDDWTGDGFEYSPSQHRFVGDADWAENVPEQYINFVRCYKGLFSTMSAHPCGILVAGPERPIEHEVPFNWVASSKQLVSSFDMYSLKKIGLFKLDLLGLGTLDHLSYMEQMSGEKVPDDNYDEPAVLAAFGAGLLAEIFQMDGYACRSVLKDIRGVQSFEDIIAANTLARPGCAQFTRYYRSGYEGLLREYPTLQEVLGPTNGLILYQEQVMEIARVLADFDDAEQDDVKESIKYFRKENWKATIEPLFLERCSKKGFNATNILEAISKMASYTYNRAHAMTYAAYAYKMMWYKVHHPAIFYAAVFDDAKDKANLVLESHFFNVNWRQPDVNESQSNTIIKNGEIFLGLNAIKGVGPAAYEAISEARPFISLEDLQERVNRRKCNSKVINCLKDAFALTSIGHSGSYSAFLEAFGFNYQFLNASRSRELAEWQKQNPATRLGGYIVKITPVKIQKEGPNKGKEMGRATVVNSLGSKNAVMFPDIWKRARTVLYQGAAVCLEGEVNTTGDFIVEHGGEIVD